uniref:Myb/SANT-like domain-containing protein n=1 Tax=Leersia perrieri TaxID=77586 RepID=A0A0D9WR98_9ORYZ
MEDDNIEVALTDIAVKSPEAICNFIWRLTPIVVVRAIDWDELSSNKLTKEITTRNFTGSFPKAKGYTNLSRKLMERRGKQCNKDQIKFITWSWLESKATGLGRGPSTGSIITIDGWWDDVERERPGSRAFRSSPLVYVDLHFAVFRGRLVVGNHSAIAGDGGDGEDTNDGDGAAAEEGG